MFFIFLGISVFKKVLFAPFGAQLFVGSRTEVWVDRAKASQRWLTEAVVNQVRKTSLLTFWNLWLFCSCLWCFGHRLWRHCRDLLFANWMDCPLVYTFKRLLGRFGSNLSQLAGFRSLDLRWLLTTLIDGVLRMRTDLPTMIKIFGLCLSPCSSLPRPLIILSVLCLYL